MVLWGVVALWLTGIAISTMFAGIGNSFDSTELNVQNIFDACLWFGGAGLCFAFVVRYERRARSLPLSGHAGTRLIPDPAPISALAAGAVLTFLGIGFGFTAVHAHADAARSSYTQAHGVLESARLSSGSSDGDGSPGGSGVGHLYLPAVLPRPVSGRTSTVVYVQADAPTTPLHIEQDLKKFSGRYVTHVRVDPDDPGYAELQYDPYGDSADAVSMEVIATLALVLGVTGTVRGLRYYFRKSRRAAVVSSGASSGR